MRSSLSTLALGLLLLSGAARAQPQDPSRVAARTLAQEGQDALDSKDFTTAAERFSRADALVHAPTLMLGLARAQVGLATGVPALETYAGITREGVAPGSPPVFGKAVADATRELAELKRRTPTVAVDLKGAASARLTLDGEPLSEGLNHPVN